MKEIDINIEGYNVNGICVGCLNYNRKMVYHKDIKECFNKLADIDIPDGLSVQVCWECFANIKRICQFRTQIFKSYEILINYSRQHTFLNSPSDFTKHSTTRLCTASVAVECITPPSTLSTENEDNVDKLPIKYESVAEPLKEEEEPFNEYEDIPIEYEHNEVQSQDDIVKDELSSEDDVQLSELKQKKQRRERNKFNTNVDIKLREWAENELPSQSVRAARDSLGAEFRVLMSRQQDADPIYAPLKQAAVEQALDRHHWEDRATDAGKVRMVDVEVINRCTIYLRVRTLPPLNIWWGRVICLHYQTSNVPTAGAQAFSMDGIWRLGHDPPRGSSADWWVLTTACLPKRGGTRDSRFLVTHPMTIAKVALATCAIELLMM
ncbi:hypothetical protein evm_014801 [Chilo suppressalis]|nr:hypothetical protein evm_014801 [Chilo suppressalis]